MVKKQNSSQSNLAVKSIKKQHTPKTSVSLIEEIDSFFESKLTIIFGILFAITLFVSSQLYDPRISLSGDDSTYIMGAYNFITHFDYPSYQGAFYPIVLSLVVRFFGIALFPLKLLSLISIMGFFTITFLSLRKRIPATLTFIVLLLISVNSHILYYASQTYSEAFYMLMLSLLVFVFAKNFFDKENITKVELKKDLKRHALLAVTLLLLSLTRSIGFSAIIAVCGYFLFCKQWKNLLLSFVFFSCFILCFQLFKIIVWGDGSLQFAGQSSGLLNKDFYNPQNGKEDIFGLFIRFLGNSKMYLSSHFYTISGFFKSEPPTEPSSFLAILVYGLTILGLFFTFRKNRLIFFIALIAGVSLMTTFTIIQVFWNQGRLIIPFVSMLWLIIFSSIYYVGKIKNLRFFLFLLPLLLIVSLLGMLKETQLQIARTSKLKNEFSGLTPDWVNYLQASRWAGSNLPKDAIVACRKGSMSSIFAKGKPFWTVTSVPTSDFNFFIDKWEKQNKTYEAFPLAKLSGVSLSQDFVASFRCNYVARAAINNEFYFITNVPQQEKQAFYQELSKYDIKVITSPNELKKIAEETKAPPTLYIADSLLDLWKKANITYVLSANIRVNPNVKDGNTISTIERYMGYINDKYPDIFGLVNQTGQIENEPATIYKIDWSKYNLKK